MSKNFKRAQGLLRNEQADEQIEQEEYYATPGIYASNGARQFKVPFTPRFVAQTVEQIEQEEYYVTPDIYASNGTTQFRMPLTPRPNTQHVEQIQQNGHYSTPDIYSSNGASQFRVPTTPFLNVPVTPMPSMPITPREVLSKEPVSLGVFRGGDTVLLPLIQKNREHNLDSVQTMLIPVFPKKSVAKFIVLAVQVLGLGLLFLGTVAVELIYLSHNLIYSIDALIILGIMFSYFVSLSFKSFYRQRRIRLVKATSKQQMAHLFLIKENTMTSLSILSKKDLKKGVVV
jgi:hypothetical protein